MKHLIYALFLFLNIVTIAQTRNFNGDTQTDMNLDASKQYEVMNNTMINMYNKILHKNNNDKIFLNNFKKAQGNWLKWRELEIEAFFPKYPDSKTFYGSMKPLCVFSKLMDWTQERINQMKIYLKGVEVDDLCGPGRN